MATVTDGRPRAAPAASSHSRRSLLRWIADHLVLFIGIGVLIYTFVPIGYIFALSFVEPTGRAATAHIDSSTMWTTSNWTSLCEPDGLCDSLKLSFEVSITATIIATVLGTLMAFSLVRHS